MYESGDQCDASLLWYIYYYASLYYLCTLIADDTELVEDTGKTKENGNTVWKGVNSSVANSRKFKVNVATKKKMIKFADVVGLLEWIFL